MSRLTSVLLTILFVAFVFTPGVAWLLGDAAGSTALENRTLAEPPVFTMDRVLDGQFRDDVSAWVWDHLPFREDLLWLDHAVDYWVLRDSPLPDKVLIGDNDFLFVRERVHGSRAGDAPAGKVIKAIDEVTAAFADAGVPLVLVISPNKASVYPEFLPPRDRELWEERVLPTLRAVEERADGPALINLWSAFRAEKERLATAEVAHPRLRYLFRPHDRHWSLEAARIQAREIVDAIDPELWHDDFAARATGDYTEAPSEISTIFLKVGPPELYQRLEQSPEVDVSVDRPRIVHGAALWRARSTATAAFAPADKKVLVIRDSFLNSADKEPSAAQGGSMQYIAPFFGEATFVHWTHFERHAKKLRPHLLAADVVVVQLVTGHMTGTLLRQRKLLVREARWLAKQRADGAQKPENPGSDDP